MALALLVVLDKLNAAERIAFLPHDTFAVSFEEIGSIVDRSPVVGSKENRIPSRPLSGGYDPLALSSEWPVAVKESSGCRNSAFNTRTSPKACCKEFTTRRSINDEKTLLR